MELYHLLCFRRGPVKRKIFSASSGGHKRRIIEVIGYFVWKATHKYVPKLISSSLAKNSGGGGGGGKGERVVE